MSEEDKNQVSILGQTYSLLQDTPANNSKLSDTYGYVEPYSKKIVVDNTIENSDDPATVENIELFKNKVYRHEIIHAFFTESGISYKFSKEDEDFLVDWIAVQFPKLQQIFNDLDISN